MESQNGQNTYETNYQKYEQIYQQESSGSNNQFYQEPDKKPKKWPVILKCILIPIAAYMVWQAVEFVVELVGTIIVLSVQIAKNPEGIQGVLESDVYTLIMNNILIFYLISAVLSLLIFYIVQRKTHFTRTLDISSRKLGVKLGIISFSIGLSLGVFINLVLGLLETTMPSDWIESHNESVAPFQDNTSIIVILVSVVCAPIIEELIFRGFLYNAIKKIIITASKEVTKATHRTAILVSSVIASAFFGIAHGNILQAMYAFVLSFFLIWIYEKTESLISNMLVHAAFNFSGVIFLLMIIYLGIFITLIVSSILTFALMAAVHSFCEKRNYTEFLGKYGEKK